MASETEFIGEAWSTTAEGTVLVDVKESDTVEGAPFVHPASLLRRMRWRVRAMGAPLPEGYVAPPGIDLADLLRQVPWPPPSADQHPAEDEQHPR